VTLAVKIGIRELPLSEIQMRFIPTNPIFIGENGFSIGDDLSRTN
jgi:hypothetical protein